MGLSKLPCCPGAGSAPAQNQPCKNVFHLCNLYSGVSCDLILIRFRDLMSDLMFNFCKLKIYVGVEAIILLIFNFYMLCSISRLFCGLIMFMTILHFFHDSFWRSSLLEYRILQYVWVHWFRCSLLPGTPLNSHCQEVGFICPFVVIDPTVTNLGATIVVVPGILLDNFLSIPDA